MVCGRLFLKVWDKFISKVRPFVICHGKKAEVLIKISCHCIFQFYKTLSGILVQKYPETAKKKFGAISARFLFLWGTYVHSNGIFLPKLFRSLNPCLYCMTFGFCVFRWLGAFRDSPESKLSAVHDSPESIIWRLSGERWIKRALLGSPESS